MRSRSARFVTLGSLLAAAVIAGGCAAPATPVRPAAAPSRPLPGRSARGAAPLPGPPGPLSATFVSPAQGWLLVSVRCGPAFCLRLDHTTDGGRQWTAVPGRQLASAALAGQIQAIRFASPRDGWAYGTRTAAGHP